MLPEYDITQAIVAAALGVSGDNMSDIFNSQAINMWSRKKPYVSSKLANATLAELETDLAAHGYGLTVPAVSRYPRTAALSAYIYNRPTANFRIGDFRAYNHDALPVISSIPAKSVVMGYSSTTFSFTFQPSGQYVLGISDIADIQDMYLAVILSSDNWSTIYIVTSDDTIGNGATSVTLTEAAPFNAAGSWQYMLVACSLPSPTSGRAQNVTSAPFSAAEYRPLPFGHVASNLAALTITGAATLYIRFNYVLTSGSSWTITPYVFLSSAHTAAVEVSITKMRITRSGGYIDYTLSTAAAAAQTYNIPIGNTTPEESMTDITQTSFRAPRPTLESGDVVKLIVTVTPSGLTTINREITIS